VWVGVHFGSRGFGHKTASGFLSMARGGGFHERGHVVHAPKPARGLPAQDNRPPQSNWPTTFVPPRTSLVEAKSFIEGPGGSIAGEHMQRCGPHPSIQEGRHERATQASSLVIWIDEDLIDVSPAGCDEADDDVIRARDPSPVPLVQLARIPGAHFVLRVGPVHEPVRDAARAPVDPGDPAQIVRLKRPDRICSFRLAQVAP
jgi:hypothetical protein